VQDDGLRRVEPRRGQADPAEDGPARPCSPSLEPGRRRLLDRRGRARLGAVHDVVLEAGIDGTCVSSGSKSPYSVASRVRSRSAATSARKIAIACSSEVALAAGSRASMAAR